MRIHRRKRKIGGKIVHAKVYGIDFRDHKGNLRENFPGFSSQRATEAMGRKLEVLVALRAAGERPEGELAKWLETIHDDMLMKLVEWGILDAREIAAAKPLALHIGDWQKHLESQDCSPSHIKQAIARVKRILRECKLNRYPEISPSRVQEWLADLRASGRSAETSNHYLKSIKAFCNFMVKDRRATENLVAFVRSSNVRVDRRHDRRALSVKELKRILLAARNGETHHCMTGSERGMLYLVAMETGFRWSELRSLTRASFVLQGDPSVTVLASCTKNERTDIIPLRRETAERLREHFKDMLPAVPAFNMPKGNKGSKMLRADLVNTGNLKAGLLPIPYVDEEGLYADFHALRHSFVTNVIAANVNPKIAQTLARHSTITLTMDRYTHVALKSKVQAVDSLPSLSAPDNVDQAKGST